jgi:hypothetical protein
MHDWPNQAVYWGAFDELVSVAKESEVRLIPVINWNTYLFCDMAGECVQDMMLDRESRSRQYLWLYTDQLVSRYKGEPTVLFWELTNEMNLLADLEFHNPLGRSFLNAVGRGANVMRLRRDHFTTEQMIPFVREWAQLVRRIDKNHLISTGFSVPRAAAQHLRLARGKGDWTHDGVEELETYMRDTNPDPIDLISIHFYRGDANQRLGNKDENSVGVLKIFKQLATKIGKPLYIGETNDLEPGAPMLTNLLDKVVELEIPFTLLWDWMSPGRFDINPQDTPQIVSLMQRANEKFEAGKD